MIGILTLTYFLLFSNLDMTFKRIIYFSSGLIGHFMVEKYVPEANKKKREGLWVIGYWLYLLCLAPMWFGMGIIAFIRTKINLI